MIDSWRVAVPSWGECFREHVDQVVEDITTPVIERTVRGDLLERVHRHLVEAGHDHVVALVGDPRVEVLGRGRDPVGHAVAKGVGQGVLDRDLVDVDRVHVGGPVEGELHGQQPLSAADVQAPLVSADPLPIQVLPDQEAALGGIEHAGSIASSGNSSGNWPRPRRRSRRDLGRTGARPSRCRRSAPPGDRGRAWCPGAPHVPRPGARGARRSSRR